MFKQYFCISIYKVASLAMLSVLITISVAPDGKDSRFSNDYTSIRNLRVRSLAHDDVIKWKQFPRYWPLVRGIHRSRHRAHYDVTVMLSTAILKFVLSRVLCFPSCLVELYHLQYIREDMHTMLLCFALLWTQVITSAHYSDVIMGAMASQIITHTIGYSTVYSGADKKKHQSSASLAFVRGIHWWPMNSPHKWPVTRKMFTFDDVVMTFLLTGSQADCGPWLFYPTSLSTTGAVPLSIHLRHTGTALF